MAPSHLSNPEFFSQLATLFDARHGKDHGRIYLTQKRLTYGSTESPTTLNSLQDLIPDQPLPVIIRATDGKSKKSDNKKIKLSTIVQPADLEGFFQHYADVCKAGMSGLRKRDRKGRKKDKTKKKKVLPDVDTKG